MNIFLKSVLVVARALGLRDQRLYQFFGGGPTYSGETVSVDGAMQIDSAWACVKLKSDTIATLPLQVYKKDTKGRGEVYTDHPLYRLLHDQPNADMTSAEFWGAMAAAKFLWGNAYAKIDRIGGRVVSLYPMQPDRLTARRNPDGSITYRYSAYGRSIELDESDVLHIKGFSLDGLVGLSPVAQARQTLGTALAAEKAAASIFRNGLRPSAVMKVPTYLTDAQRTQAEQMVQRYSGALATGGVPMLEGGWELNQFSMNPDDVELLQTREFHTEQICRWYGVPPPLVGHLSKTSSWPTSLEQLNLLFLTYGLRADLKRIEQAIARCLLTPSERLNVYAEFNVAGLMRGDSAGQAALYSTYAQNGLRTRNELRAMDNEPPMLGGDELTVQSNLLPVTMLGEVARLAKEKPVDPNRVPVKPVVAAPSENQNVP